MTILKCWNASILKRMNLVGILDDWITVTGTLDDFEERLLSEFIQDIKRAGRDRNEEKLKMTFCVSRLYDATNIEDLRQIVFILRKLKK